MCEIILFITMVTLDFILLDLIYIFSIELGYRIIVLLVCCTGYSLLIFALCIYSFSFYTVIWIVVMLIILVLEKYSSIAFYYLFCLSFATNHLSFF